MSKKPKVHRQEIYQVKLVRPIGVDALQMARYIREAVDAWKGQLYQDDPLCDLQPCTVRRITK